MFYEIATHLNLEIHIRELSGIISVWTLDSAPFFTYLFLWIHQLKILHFRRDRRFFNDFQIIDGLTTINDGRENERRCNAIYNGEPEFKKKNIGCYEGSCFDLVYKIEH